VRGVSRSPLAELRKLHEEVMREFRIVRWMLAAANVLVWIILVALCWFMPLN